jgi:hypothetical protein
VKAGGSPAKRAADLALRVAGTLVAVGGAVATALVEAFLTPLYAGTVRLPAAAVLAVVTNAALVWFTYRATGHKLVALLPGLAWMAIMIVAAGRTTEGDIVLAGDNWVAMVTIFAGVGGYAFAAYRLLNAPLPDRLVPTAPTVPIVPTAAGPAAGPGVAPGAHAAPTPAAPPP